MALTPNVVPNTPIEASWGNEIRDRTVQRFASYAELTSSWVGPAEASHAYLLDENVLLVHNGSAWVCVTPQNATTATTQSTSNGAFVDLATAGPAVTVRTGTRALVTVGANINPGATGNGGGMSVAVSGASTIAAVDANAVSVLSSSGGAAGYQLSYTSVLSGLTAGVNTFTAKYRILVGGTCAFSNRSLTVVGLP